MAKVSHIVSYIEGLAGHAVNRDEGVQHGSVEREVQRVLITWMATADALTHAGEMGCDLVLAHESLYYPYDAVVRQDNPLGWENWRTNRQRREILERHNLTLLRAHGSLDEICILDEFASLLGLGEPVAAEGLARVYEITPRPLADLLALVKERARMTAVRVSCPRGMEQVVRRVGLPWGGLGLFVNVGYQHRVLELGADVLIAGESDDYGFRFSAEWGVPVIETGHEVSENPGLRRFSQMLQERFAEMRVAFYECAPSWQMG